MTPHGQMSERGSSSAPGMGRAKNLFPTASMPLEGPQDAVYAHEDDDDHYHDHDDYNLDYNPEYDSLWQSDNVELISVGIDIGSSGTQVVFSRIKLQRLGDHLSSRYFVVSREQLYQSPVSFTPYAEGLRIDKGALASIIDDAYNNAGITPEGVDTGAVILTGEALRRENAHSIAHILAEHGGQFVCTMAGHHIEAMLAAYGSGAAWASNNPHKRILNVDIGGGTTKFAVVENGRITATAAIHIGGRLHVFDARGALTRLEPAGRVLAANSGMTWNLGGTITDAQKDRLGGWMAEAIISALTEPNASETIRALFLTDPLPALEDITGVMFSGGVSEYIYGNESRDFSDMGRILGGKLSSMCAAGELPWPLLPAGAGIRATALGLSEYSVQLSGNTIYVSDPNAVLPRRNLRVVHPDCKFPDVIDPKVIADAVTSYVQKYALEEIGTEFVLAFHWCGTPTYARIFAFAAGLALGLANEVSGKRPIYIVMDGDIARTLGRILHSEFHVNTPLLIVDGISLSDFNYIDFGKIRMPSKTIPVTIKSLLFSKDPRTEQLSGVKSGSS